MFDLPELLQQKELLEKHLFWLQKKIDVLQAKPDVERKETSKNIGSIFEPTSYIKNISEDLNKQGSHQEEFLPPPIKRTPNPGSAKKVSLPILTDIPREPQTGLTLKNKIGCILGVVLLCALILGTFFILPYFIFK